MPNAVYKLLVIFLCIAALAIPGSCLAKNTVTITLTGVPANIKTNILAQLSLKKLAKEDLSNQQIDILYEKTETEIQEAIKPFGYYNAQITPKLEFDINKHGDYAWHASFTIDLGEPSRITEINFNIVGPGVDDIVIRKIKIPSILKEGDILEHSKYEQAKYDLLSSIVDLGYINANFKEHKVVVNKANHTCYIYLTIDTDKLFYFGNVNIADTNLNTDFIKKYVNLRFGERLSPSKIIKIEQNLANAGYFANVKIQQEVQPNSTYLTINIIPTLQKRNKFAAGIGYATDEGPRFAASWNNRYLNQTGHNFTSSSYFSSLYQLAKFKYNIPGNNPVTTNYYSGLNMAQDNHSITLNNNTINKFITKSTQLDIGQEYKYNHLFRKLSFNIMSSSSIQYITTSNGLTTTSYPYQLSTIIYPQLKIGTSLIAEQSDIPYGIKAEISGIAGVNNVTNFYTNLSATTKYFAQVTAKYKQLLPIAQRFGFLIKGELGATFPQDNNLPDNMLFLTGGDNSLRGYHYNTIGVLATVNNEATVLGGNYLYLLTLEAQAYTFEHFNIFCFFDLGNASNTFDTNFKRDFGAGVMWRFSIGEIKLSIAVPMDDPTIIPTTHRSFRLNLNFEQDF